MITVDRKMGLPRAARNAAGVLAFCLLPLVASADATPPLLYQIGKGVLSYNGQILASGHAGRYEGRDNVAMETVRNRGPIPEGVYAIGPPQNNWLGEGAMPLTPAKDTRTYGRTAFWIHKQLYAQGTHGCIGLTPEGLKQVADLRRANKVGVLVVQP